jgi:hypothetical protein
LTAVEFSLPGEDKVSRGSILRLDISVYVIDALGMKLIQFTLSADCENLGSFTLDPYTQL